jgi:hypothetical protein
LLPVDEVNEIRALVEEELRIGCLPVSLHGSGSSFEVRHAFLLGRLQAPAVVSGSQRRKVASCLACLSQGVASWLRALLL